MNLTCVWASPPDRYLFIPVFGLQLGMWTEGELRRLLDLDASCLGGDFLGQVTGSSPRQSSFSSEIVGTLITWQRGGGGHLTGRAGADKRRGFHWEEANSCENCGRR